MLPEDRISKIEELQGRVLAVNLQSLTPLLESHLAPRGVRLQDCCGENGPALGSHAQ